MKVKNLIKFLQKTDPEDEVILYDLDEAHYYRPIIEKYERAICITHSYGESEYAENPH